MSSSSSRKRTEHIERTRYPNPLPLPPYPPKQLSINTNPSRYVDPRAFGQRLAASVPLPMVVDAEAGMPLDMTSFPACWYTDQELADAEAHGGGGAFPVLDRSQMAVDEEDAFLLSDLLNASSSQNGHVAADGANGTATPERGQPTWLKRTEYLAAAEKKARRSELASRHATMTDIDSSREAQLERIRATFDAANEPLETLRHPTKPHLRAVEAFSLLPDTDTWATRIDVFRFGDAPGRHVDGRPAPDPRLQTAILRPHEDALGQPLYSLFAIDAPEEEEETVDQEEDNDMFGSEEDDSNNNDSDDDEDAANKRRARKARKQKTRRAFRSREEQIAAEDAESQRAVETRIRGMPSDAQRGDLSAENKFETVESEERPIHMSHIRDYEPHDQTMRNDQELVLSFLTGTSQVQDDTTAETEKEGGSASNGTLPPVTTYERSYRTPRGSSSRLDKVALYHPVSMRASLRVRRKKWDDKDSIPPEHFDIISLGKRSLSTYEKIERLHERKLVDDLDVDSLPERIDLPEPVEEEEEEETVEAGGTEHAADAKVDVDGKVDDEDEDDSDEDQRRAKVSLRREENAADADEAAKDIASDDDDEGGRKDEDEGEGEGEGEEDEEEDEDEDEGQPSRERAKGKKKRADSDSDDEEDDEEGSDEDMDEDELEALRADAGDDVGVDEGADEALGSRRSRREPRAVATAGDTSKEATSVEAPVEKDGADRMDVDSDAESD